jgi:predicted RND superfamily exporter protein
MTVAKMTFCCRLLSSGGRVELSGWSVSIVAVVLTVASRQLAPTASCGTDRPEGQDPKATPSPRCARHYRITHLKAGITGTAAQTLGSQASDDRATVIMAVTTVGLIIILLPFIFRSPIIALPPIVTIGVVSQIATGLIPGPTTSVRSAAGGVGHRRGCGEMTRPSGSVR